MLHTRMCTSECTVKLDDLISNINNESLKKICSSISDYVISTTDKQINNFMSQTVMNIYVQIKMNT